jgi:hypothetical protein
MAHRETSLVIRNSVDNRMREQKRMFIDALEKVATVTVACKAIGKSVVQVYQWRKDDEDFAKDWDNAIAYAFEALESATYLKLAKMLKRDYQRINSAEARLIEVMLASAKPEKYRQRGIEIDNSTNVSNLTIDWATVPQAIFDAFQRNELTLEDVYQQTLLLNAQQKTSVNDTEV